MEEILKFFNGSSDLKIIANEGYNSFGYNDTVNIEFYYRKLEIYNNLIGSFDKNGEYKIRQEFLEELVKVPKLAKETFSNLINASYESKNGKIFNINFAISISEEPGSKLCASLYLKEELVNLNDGNITMLSTLVARYRDDKDAYFLDKVRKVFNLYSEEDGEGKTLMSEETIARIFMHKSALLRYKKLFELESEKIEEEYFLDMIKLLKGAGEYGEFVIKSFLKLQKEFNINPSNKNYKQLTKILDMALSNAKTYPLNNELKEKLVVIQNDRIKKYLEFTKPLAMPQAKKIDKSRGASKGSSDSGGSKGGGGSSGGKEEKKAEKKEEEKKKALGGAPKKEEKKEEAKKEEKKEVGKEKDKEEIKSILKGLVDSTYSKFIGKTVSKIVVETNTTFIGDTIIEFDSSLGGKEK